MIIAIYYRLLTKYINAVPYSVQHHNTTVWSMQQRYRVIYILSSLYKNCLGF